MESSSLSFVSSPFEMLTGLLTTTAGMARSSEVASLLPQLASSLWAAVATGRLMPVLTPILLNLVVYPALLVIKAVAKTMIFIGVVAWLLSSMIPVFLTTIGMPGAGVIVGRAFQSTPIYSYTEGLDLNGFTNMTGRGLEYLELDSEECRVMLSCRAGEFVVDNFPVATQLIRATRIGSFLDTYARAGNDDYVLETVNVLMGRKNGTCEQELSPCISLTRWESFFDDEKEEILRNLTLSTTTTTTPPPRINEVLTHDFVVNAIKKVASSTSSDRTGNFFFNLFANPKI